jgi:two-component system LytT family response regulator
MTVRTIVVDDEHLARRRLRSLLSPHKDFIVIGESGSGAEAMELIESTRPDVVFLDVQMPGLSGLDVARLLVERGITPWIVFVTAFEQYALPAFRLGVIQYLVKPIERDAFRQVIERVRQVTATRSSNGPRPAPRDTAPRIAPRRDARKLIAVRDGGQTILLRVGDVDWFEAAGNYVRIHVGSKTYTIRETIEKIAMQLDELKFGRIHRSSIVNFDRITALHADTHGDYVVSLRDGTTLPLSRSFRDRIPLLMGRL